MTTFLFFAELLVNHTLPKPNKATESLYKGMLKNSKSWYYIRWDEVERHGQY